MAPYPHTSHTMHILGWMRDILCVGKKAIGISADHRHISRKVSFMRVQMEDEIQKLFSLKLFVPLYIENFFEFSQGYIFQIEDHGRGDAMLHWENL